jgi:hypothetical protein
LSVMWQQQVARHGVIDFPQNARNGPTRSPEDLPTSPTRHTDVEGPGAIPHQVLCILLRPVDGYTPTFSERTSYPNQQVTPAIAKFPASRGKACNSAQVKYIRFPSRFRKVYFWLTKELGRKLLQPEEAVARLHEDYACRACRG